MMQVSAVIPSYNGLELLKQNLPAVLECLRPDDEVLIVDDASSDDTVAWLRETYDLEKTHRSEDFTVWHKAAVRLVSNHHNVRFGQAVNRGVDHATGELIFLLNSDVRPQPDVLKFLVPYFERDRSVFAVGCLEQEADQLTGGKNKLWFARGRFLHSRADNFEQGETAWVSGGSGLFDKAKWQELGGFDPRYYPAYWEDIDLSHRARQHGWRILFEPKAVVEHVHETTNDDVFGQKKIRAMSWRHGSLFTWTHASFWQKLQYLMWKPYWWWKTKQF